MNFVKSLAVETFDNISIIRFIRPEIKNPLSLQTLDELEQSFVASASRTIILTGSGDTFAAGANLNEINSLTKDTAREFARRGQALMQMIYNSDKLTIAAINGSNERQSPRLFSNKPCRRSSRISKRRVGFAAFS